jgi:hypothetical protein
MKVVYWALHPDEFERVDHYLKLVGIECEKYTDRTPPTEFDLLFVHCGPFAGEIPQHRRKDCIIVFCIHTMHLNQYYQMGYSRAILKNSEHKKHWMGEGVILHPLVKVYEPAPVNEKLVSIIHFYRQRDENGYYQALNLGALVYGQGNELGEANDHDLFKQGMKALFHVKRCGYLCNAVIKGISYGVPIIMDRTTWDYGYQDILIPNYNMAVFGEDYKLDEIRENQLKHRLVLHEQTKQSEILTLL